MVARFIVRLVICAALLAPVYAVAQCFWQRFGLDGVAAAADLHATGTLIVGAVPFVIALIAGRARYLAALILGFCAGGLITAPFVLSRLAA